MLRGLPALRFNSVYSLNLTASVDNLIIGNDPGSSYLNGTTRPIDLYVQIMPSVVLGAALKVGAAKPDPALFFDLPSGSRIYIINHGSIRGGGGIGGRGDRGRRDTKDGNTFVGGGGGGGAGSSSQGGARGVNGGGSSATAGDAGTVTTGGAAGSNADGGAGEDGWTLGVPVEQYGGDAIAFHSGRAITIRIANYGEIHAGGRGGAGGYQDGPLPGGSVAPESGASLATSVTTLIGTATDEAAAVSYNAEATLAWIDNTDVFPGVRGYINRRP